MPEPPALQSTPLPGGGGAVVRRVVTGSLHPERPGVLSDGAPPRTHHHVATPGMVNSAVWSTSAPPTTAETDPTPALLGVVPGPGETRALVVTFPPDAVCATPTVDYAVVLQGRLTLGPGTDSTELAAGDVVVQNGTRHAWRNPTDELVTAVGLDDSVTPVA